MNVTLMDLRFERDISGKVVFNSLNINLLLRYVIPIISNNPGWSTEDLSKETFLDNPDQLRDEVNATVGEDMNNQVRIALDGEGNPVGLLEYVKEDFKNLSQPEFSKVFNEMLSDKSNGCWEKLIRMEIVEKDSLDKHFGALKAYFEGKSLYKDVGIVLTKSLQGTNSGISDILYHEMSNGLIYGWTSSPLVILKRRKLFKHTLFSPKLGDMYNKLEDLVCLVVLAASYFRENENVVNHINFGMATYNQFAVRDEREYTALAKSCLEKGKILASDFEKLQLILKTYQCQGSIISIS